MKHDQHYTQSTIAYYNARFGEHFEAQLNVEEKLRWSVLNSELQRIMNRSNMSAVEILDFGCGNGRFSFLLSQYGKVTGVDVAERAIEKAKDQFPKLSFLAGDASNEEVISLINRQFDIVVSTEVVEHVLDQQQYFKNIQHLLKPSGYLILTTPNQKWFDEYFDSGRRKSTQPFEYWLSAKQINDTISTLGFEILKLHTFRSEWIFEFKISGLLSLIGNRWVRKLLQLTGLRDLFVKNANRFGLGINLLLLARKKEV